MEIGDPQREYTIEPAVTPVPEKQPATEPIRRREPSPDRDPAKKPEKVPAGPDKQ